MNTGGRESGQRLLQLPGRYTLNQAGTGFSHKTQCVTRQSSDEDRSQFCGLKGDGKVRKKKEWLFFAYTISDYSVP